MSIAINKVFFAGNLTRDLEDRTLDSGTVVANGAIAVNDRQKIDGEWKDTVMFIDFTMFGKLAERCAKHLVKGDTLHIEGRLQEDKWNDRESGEPRSRMKVVCNDATFIRWGRDNAAKGSSEGGTDKPPF